MRDLTSKIAFVTGGSSGYGKATAKLLTEKGAIVIIASRTEEKLKEAISEGCGTEYFVMDVTVPSDWENAYKYVNDKYGKIDILLNVAGGGVSIVPAVDQTFENIDNAMKLNICSAAYGSKVFGKMMMVQKNGLIINFSSVCAKEAWPGWSVYAASKWAVLGFSKGLYVEMQPYNVRVTCMIPAAASTGFQKNTGIGEIVQALTAEDVAQATVDVCEMPEHVCIEEMTIWGTDQVVIPL